MITDRIVSCKKQETSRVFVELPTRTMRQLKRWGQLLTVRGKDLGTSDLPIIHMRRLLLQQVKAFQKGAENFKLDNNSLKDLYSAGIYDSNQKSWQEAFPMEEKFKADGQEVKS